MSDERVDVVLREAGGKAGQRVWDAFRVFLKRHFPIFTDYYRDYAEAMVAQEQARARDINADADLKSAKAEEIRARIRSGLVGLEGKNLELLAQVAESEARKQEAAAQALAELSNLFSRAERMGLGISIEALANRTQQPHASEPDDQRDQ
jgi:hypothetical protein